MSAIDRGRLLLKLADAIEADAENLRASRSSTPAIRCATRADSTCRAPLSTFRYFGGMADKFEGSRRAGRSRVPELRHARAGRRRRPDRALELPAHVHELEDGAGAGGGQHGGAEALGTDAAVHAAHCGADARCRLSAPAWSTSSPATGRPPARGSPNTRTSTRSPSPAQRRSDAGSCAARPGNLKKVQLELGGKGANIVFDDANLPLRSAAPPSPSSTTRARLASPVRDCSSREDRRRVPGPLPRARPLDQARRPDVRCNGDGAADLAPASAARAGLLRDRARRGRRDPDWRACAR